MQHKAPYQKTLVGILAAAGILSLAGCGPKSPSQDATQPTTTTPPATETNAVGVQQVTTPTSHENESDKDDRDERGDDDRDDRDDDRKQAVTQHPINKPTATSTTPSTSTTATTATKVLNGIFHLTNTYGSPAGPEPLDATVTLKDGVITAVSAKNVAVNQRSKTYQDMFISGIAGSIVGKNIKDVNITHVNGSSLTAASFNTVLHELQK